MKLDSLAKNVKQKHARITAAVMVSVWKENANVVMDGKVSRVLTKSARRDVL